MSYGRLYMDYHKLIKSKSRLFTLIDDWDKVTKPGFYRTDVGASCSPDSNKKYVGIAISHHDMPDKIFCILSAEADDREKQYICIYNNGSIIWTKVVFDTEHDTDINAPLY